MKSKLLIAVSTLSLGLSMSVCASDTATIVNQNKHNVIVNYTLCNDDKSFCTHIKTNEIFGLSSQVNSLNVMIPLNESAKNFTLNSATEITRAGKTVAELKGPCSLATGYNSIVLSDHGTSRLFCELANVKL